MRLKNLDEATSRDLRDVGRAWLSDGMYALEVLPFEADHNAIVVNTDRSAAPHVGTPHDLKLPPLQEATLSNGLRLLLAERHDIPVVNFWLDVSAGFAADQGFLSGTARITSALLTGGTKRRSALEISDELLTLGAQLNSGCNLDISTVYLSALKPALDDSLDLFADVILNPVFPDADFERQRQLQLAAIANEKVTPLQMALRALPPILFGSNHAYGAPLTGSGTEESVQQLNREHSARFHATWFKPNNATLVVVGDTTLPEIRPKLEERFSGWLSGSVPQKQLPAIERPSKPVIYLVDKPGALHSVVVAGTLAPPPAAQTETTLETMNNVFGGTFGARLNMNLREDKHWSYGAGSVLYAARAQRPFLAYASVQGDKTAESLSEILNEIAGMNGARPITGQELEKVKQQQIFELPGAHETMNAIGNLFGDLLQLGLPLDFYDDYVERVSAITLADIESAASSLLDPRKMIWMVVGDRSQIEKPLKELAIGEIVVTQS
jgi:zinc protease